MAATTTTETKTSRDQLLTARAVVCRRRLHCPCFKTQAKLGQMAAEIDRRLDQLDALTRTMQPRAQMISHGR